MSYIFKKGDVVRYKKSEAYAMPSNLHGEPDHTKEFVVASNDYDPQEDVSTNYSIVMFEGDKGRAGALAYRLELVKSASKENKPKPDGNFTWGVFLANGQLAKTFQTRKEARQHKSNTWLSMTVKKIKYEIV